MTRKIIWAALLVLATVACAQAASTINPTQPAANAPLNSAPVRNNFGAAFNDINNILTQFSGPTAPAAPSTGQYWLDTSVSPALVKIWDGAQWVTTASFSTSLHQWTPFVGNQVLMWQRLTTLGATGTCLVSTSTTTIPTFQSCLSPTSFVATAPLSWNSGTTTISLSMGSAFAVSGSALHLATGASGSLMAVTGGSTAEPAMSSWTDFADRAISSSPNAVPVRGASVWGTVPIGASGASIPLLSVANTWGAQQFYNDLTLVMKGATSGETTMRAAAIAGTNSIMRWPAGSVDFTATGGTGQVVKQITAGAQFTVGTVAASEVSSPTALTRTNDTNVTLTLGGAPTTALLSATSLTVGWSGQLAVPRGGTGLASGTSGGIPYFNSTTTMASSGLLAVNGFVLGGGTGASPTTTQITGLVLGAGASAPSAYAGTSCTNQFPRSQNASGVWTCATVANTDLANSQITFGSLPISLGGTLAATSARGASGFNVESIHTTGDANVTIAVTSRTEMTTTTLTAQRTWTLPAANGVNAGQTVIISDTAGAINGANTILVSRAGSDTINGANSVALTTQYGQVVLVSDGTSKWTYNAAAAGGGGTVTNATISAGTGISTSGTCSITTTGTCTVTNSGLVTPARQVFTATGTYTPTSGMKYVDVTCTATGGNGGTGNLTTNLTGGGGGGSGETVFGTFSAATVGASKSVTIGATTADTCFGGAACTSSLLVAKSGTAGTNASAGGGGTGGAGGTGGTTQAGNPDAKGGAGSVGTIGIVGTIDGAGGGGGASFWGGGGSGGVGAGQAGSAYGSGGGGGGSAGPGAGGAAATGICVMKEYL